MIGIYQELKTRVHRLASDGRFSEILVGSAWALPSRTFGTLLTLGSSVIVGRVYGAGALGVVALVTSFLALAMLPATFGSTISILRIIPEQANKHSFTSAYKAFCKIQFLVVGVSVASGAVFLVAANVIAARVFGKPELSHYFRLAAPFVLFQSLLTLNAQVFRGLKLVRTFAIMQFLHQGLNLLLLLVLAAVVHNTSIPVYALLGSTALTGIVSVPIAYHAFKVKMQPGDSVDPISTKEILTLSLPIGLGHFEGRGWRGFHHHASLCIAAYGFLVRERCLFPPPANKPPRPADLSLSLPRPEIGHTPRGAAGTH